MKKILVVVDMQNDFITGPLGTPEAVNIVDNVVKKICGEEWDAVCATQDTHFENYLKIQEGKKLPVAHCVLGTDGHKINEKIVDALMNLPKSCDASPLLKMAFGSLELPDWIGGEHWDGNDDDVISCSQA